MATGEKKTLNLKSLEKATNEQIGGLQEQMDGFNERMDLLEEQIGEIGSAQSNVAENVGAMMQMLEGMTAKNRPTTIRQETHSESIPGAGDGGVVSIPSDAEEVQIQELVTGQPHHDSPEFREKAERMQFDQDKLTIRFEEAANEDDAKVFMAGVNGRTWVFYRGFEYENVPRNVVEVLLSARPATYTNVEYTREDGVRDVRHDRNQTLRYPFSILEDPAGEKGRDWFRQIKSQAA